MSHRITPPKIDPELLAETQRLWDQATREELLDYIWNGAVVHEGDEDDVFGLNAFWPEDDLWPTE